MIKSDFDVQVKLTIMYLVGVVVVFALLGYLIYKHKRIFTKFTAPLMVVMLIMIYILVTVIRLS
ncbi:hypothetical protein MOO44_03230 [Nicoliella spurrieriana]|uniref:Uncharacterized protein n=1 Tax=Nicoliella spurrieriana TaxID=2925830 RepID=A0A976RSS6_9LACO|nr:hypothetical protein [Nicoliella spurrieriana]UQS87187.1 hypothetical protein MOO44_03230 [Nicoliella spurrieriana]